MYKQVTEALDLSPIVARGLSAPFIKLLGGMIALPSSEWNAAPDPAPPLPGDWADLGSVSHGFTHFELQLLVRALHLAARPPLAGNWLNVDEMAGAGLPTLFRKAVTLALAHTSGSEAE